MMTIVNHLDLEDLHLADGVHEGENDQRMSIMEAVAYVAGEPWTDHPACASPVIGAFVGSWNDQLDDDARQQLKPYVTRLVGTAGTPEQEDTRAWMALDWLVRDYTPIWLRLADLTSQADRLVRLPELRAGMNIASARPAIDAVRLDAGAASGDAWAATWPTAEIAAKAAGSAAGEAVEAVGDAAAEAAWEAVGAAWDAAAVVAYTAGEAAEATLAPAVAHCQRSAHQLIDRMIAVTADG